MTTRFSVATDQPFLLLPYTYFALLLAGQELVRSRRAVFAKS
jgi:hypothetical protein